MSLPVGLPHKASWQAYMLLPCAMMPAGNHLCKQSYQCTVSSELICVDACALTWSKCSSHIMHALTAGCPSMPSCALSAGMTQKSKFIAEIQQFLQVINADAELAVCKLYPARYDRVEDVMTASLSSRTQQVLAVDISKLDTKLVTAKEGTKLFGLVYKNTADMASSWSQDAGLGCSRCNPTHKVQR